MYEVRSISSFRSSIKRNRSSIIIQGSYIFLSHPFPILHMHRQVHSISATCAAVLRFPVELLRCPDVVLVLLLRSQCPHQCQIEFLAACSALERGRSHKERDLENRVDVEAPPSSRHQTCQARIAWRAQAHCHAGGWRLLKQLSTLLSDGRSQMACPDHGAELCGCFQP